jgi:hypothetical protein
MAAQMPSSAAALGQGLLSGAQVGAEIAARRQQAATQAQQVQNQAAQAMQKQLGQVADYVMRTVPATDPDYLAKRANLMRQVNGNLGLNLPAQAYDDPEDFDDPTLGGLAAVVGAGGEAFTLSEGQKRFDAQGNVIAAVGKQEETKDIQPLVKDLRSRYDKFNSDFRVVDASYKKVLAVPDSPAGDVSLIFNYMKINDPGASVMEGDIATAQNAANVDDRLRNLYNRLLGTGERLTPDQRADFRNTAKQVYTAQQDAADEQIAALLSQADEDGVPHARILGTKALREFEKRAAERLIKTTKRPPPPENIGTPAKQTGRAAVKSRNGKGFQEGQTATNPQTGEKVIFKDGRWQSITP